MGIFGDVGRTMLKKDFKFEYLFKKPENEYSTYFPRTFGETYFFYRVSDSSFFLGSAHWTAMCQDLAISRKSGAFGASFAPSFLQIAQSAKTGKVALFWTVAFL